MDIAYQLYHLRPFIFDIAGLILIGAVLLFFSYIRYDMPWMAKFSWYMFLIGGLPLLYFACTGYFGGASTQVQTFSASGPLGY
jgi:hypothetical protein